VTDGQTDRYPLAITAVCTASDAQCGRAVKTTTATTHSQNESRLGLDNAVATVDKMMMRRYITRLQQISQFSVQYDIELKNNKTLNQYQIQ